ncbi:hypothetical protein [Halorussus halobius]|uniref:hypothetical protein n=1 Tax=Halorussus halobius TaxID=1710537 RepID=UPI001091BB63|nr:hypothetical protein [Halorussus halobius]
MASETMNQIRKRADRTGARTVLVRGRTAPPRPPATVTVAPSVTARVVPDRRRGSLLVTAETRCGRTIRRYDGRDVGRAVDAAATLAAEREPRSVWLCGRARVGSWWSGDVVASLDRRLAAAARRADARLVGWTTDEDGAAGDRYDVTLDP